MRLTFSFLLGLIAAVFTMEAALRLLPVNSGLRMQSTSAESPYSRFVPDQAYTYSFGWALGNARHGKINHDGFNNSADFHDGARALVVGDSFIEALMLDYPDTLQGRLDAALGGGVYAAAASANGLADSLEVVRHFVPRIHAATVVLFVEPGDISELVGVAPRGHSYFVVADGAVSLRHNPYSESASKQLMLRSSLVRYVYYNLKFPEWLAGKLAPPRRPVAAPAVANAERRRALDYYFDQLHAVERANGTRFVFLLDPDRKAIYADGRAGASAWHGADREFMLAAARDAGFAVVDPQPAFAAHWGQRRERMDFLPMDGHWNAVGHRIAAEQLLPLLRGAAPPAAE